MNLLQVSLVVACGSVSWAQNAPVDFASLHAYDARVTMISGSVLRFRDGQPWVLTAGQRVRVQDVIAAGNDASAHFEVAGGSSFDLFSNSRVIFRGNPANPADLLEVLGGRVEIHVRPVPGQLTPRIFSPVATITAHGPATVAMAIDQDDRLRLDVIEGGVFVQHRFLPSRQPVMIRAADAVIVDKDYAISRRVDRGSLYRFTVKSAHAALTAITFGHSGAHDMLAQAHYTDRRER